MWEGRRSLPLWMSPKNDDERKEKKPLKTTRKKKKAARAVFYCMNEKELLEAAAAYLGYQHVTPLSVQKVQSNLEDAVGKCVSSIKKIGKQVALEEGDAACDENYVSETHLDVADMETVPYTGSTHEEKEEDTKRQMEKAEKQHLTENQGGDDAMRLVREIFFT